MQSRVRGTIYPTGVYVRRCALLRNHQNQGESIRCLQTIIFFQFLRTQRNGSPILYYKVGHHSLRCPTSKSVGQADSATCAGTFTRSLPLDSTRLTTKHRTQTPEALDEAAIKLLATYSSLLDETINKSLPPIGFGMYTNVPHPPNSVESRPSSSGLY